MVKFQIFSRSGRKVGDKKSYLNIRLVLGGVEIKKAQASEYGMTNAMAVDEIEQFLSNLRLGLRKQGVDSTVERIDS